MMILNGDAKREISNMIAGISQNERPVISILDAVKLSSKYPLLILLLNVIAWCGFYLKNVLVGDNAGMPFSFYLQSFDVIMSYGGWLSLGLNAFFAFAFVLMFVAQAMIFLSIPKDVRDESQIIAVIKSGLKKIALLLLVLGSSTTVIAIFTNSIGILKFSMPAVLIISMLCFVIYIGMQSVKFGLGPFIIAAKGLLKQS